VLEEQIKIHVRNKCEPFKRIEKCTISPTTTAVILRELAFAISILQRASSHACAIDSFASAAAAEEKIKANRFIE
jgi:hypothetical protein